MASWVRVRYACAACGAWSECLVPARQDEGLRCWLDATLAHCLTDHGPRCAGTLYAVRILATGARVDPSPQAAAGSC